MIIRTWMRGMCDFRLANKHGTRLRGDKLKAESRSAMVIQPNSIALPAARVEASLARTLYPTVIMFIEVGHIQLLVLC
jgi:hypothetical protein